MKHLFNHIADLPIAFIHALIGLSVLILIAALTGEIMYLGYHIFI